MATGDSDSTIALSMVSIRPSEDLEDLVQVTGNYDLLGVLDRLLKTDTAFREVAAKARG